MGTELQTKRVDETQPEIFGIGGPDASWHRRLVRFLVEPWAALSPSAAFRARVVAILVLANLITSTCAAIGVLIIWWARVPMLLWVLVVSCVANLVMYMLARTRHYRWPGIFLVISVPAGVITSVQTIPDTATFVIALCWLVIGIGIASFLLPGWASVLVLVLYLLIPPVLVHVQGRPYGMLVGLELFIVTASFFILFHNWVIRRGERAADEQREVKREHVRARQKAEAAFSSRDEQLQITLDSIGDGVIATDGDGRIAELNRAASVLTGVSAQDALGQPLDQVVRLLDPDTNVPTTVAELATASSQHVDALLQQGEDVVLRVEITRAPLRDADGTRVGAVLALRDHTHRLALEEQLQQAQRLEAVGRLAGGVAHDFNNLLFSISSLTELMEMSADEDFPFSQELTDILEAVDRGSALTAQLLAFSRRQVLRLELLDLGRVSSELSKMLRRVIGEDIELQIHTASEPSPVRADRSQLEQILLNLALNAREAMPDGGKLSVETTVVELGGADLGQAPELPPGRYVLLSVSDTGQGMSEEVRERIFEPFFTTKDRGRGSGLGLSMVYGLVKQHSGQIQVHSAAERGTVFKVYLPVADPADAKEAAAQAPEQPLPGAGEIILLAEDEEMPRELTARALNQLGYRVLVARDGAHALEVAAEHGGPIHLLLTDVLMPRMTGPELYRELEVLRPQLPVLYLSGYTDDTVVEHGVLKEGTHFLEKPVSLRKLARKIRQVIGNGGGSDPAAV